MVINFRDLYKKYNVKSEGVVHIGAHEGGELPVYVELGLNKFVMFEPQKTTFNILNHNCSKYSEKEFLLYNVALGNMKGIAELNVNTNNAKMSSSLLKPKEHLKEHPTVFFEGTEQVTVDMLDNYIDSVAGCNFLNIDVQGYELEVFKGGTKVLEKMDYIYSEVNVKELYENNVLIDELDSFLYNFERVETQIFREGWGDAFYIRKTLL